MKIERANNTLRQAEFIIRFAAERKIVKYGSRRTALEGSITRCAYPWEIYQRSEKFILTIIPVRVRSVAALPSLGINSLITRATRATCSRSGLAKSSRTISSRYRGNPSLTRVASVTILFIIALLQKTPPRNRRASIQKLSDINRPLPRDAYFRCANEKGMVTRYEMRRFYATRSGLPPKSR